jgi:hypothetical protein
MPYEIIALSIGLRGIVERKLGKENPIVILRDPPRRPAIAPLPAAAAAYANRS